MARQSWRGVNGTGSFGERLSTLWLVLMMCVSVPAFADSYTINFAVSTGAPTPLGSFDFDGMVFSKFYVNWDHSRLDFTAAANGFSGLNGCFDHSATGPTAVFEVLSQSIPCAGATYLWFAQAPGTVIDLDDVLFNWTVPCGSQSLCDPIVPNGDFFAGYLYESQVTPFTNVLSLDPATAQGGWTLTDSSTSIPEPSSLCILGAALCGFGLRQIRARSSICKQGL